MRDIVMPQIALGTDEVIAHEWLVQPGDSFKEGDPLIEIETDKASMEVEALFDGVLVSHACAPGDTVAVGAVIGHAVDEGDDVETARAEIGAVAPAANPVFAGELAGLRPPAARTASDAPDAAGPFERRPLSRGRAAIARRVTLATAIPTFVVQRDVQTQAATASVSALRAAGHRVTLTDLLLKAAGVAATVHPEVNAWIVDDEVMEFRHVAVALAVDTPAGVVAPVIRDVGSRTVVELAAVRADLVERARARTLDARELSGATMTLSNVAGLGAHGIVPILTVPQAVALGVGAARPTEAGEAVAVTFVGDHRVLDGADGARFLHAFADALQTRIDP